MILDAIDPGARKATERASYRARFDCGELVEVGRLTYAQARLLGSEDSPDVAVVEKPQLDGRSSKAAAGLLALSWYGALTVGALGARVIVEYEPDDWKGQVAKPVHHLKLWRILTTLERQCFPADTEAIIERGVEATARAGGRLRQYSAEVTNMLDAAALGCFHLKRIGKGGGKIR